MCAVFRRTHLISLSNYEKLREKRKIVEFKKIEYFNANYSKTT